MLKLSSCISTLGSCLVVVVVAAAAAAVVVVVVIVVHCCVYTESIHALH